MKKCDIFKGLILTDYMDGRLDEASTRKIEDHLLECGECRAFFKEAEKCTQFLARPSLRQPVPAELWDAIKQNIEQEDQAVSPLEGFIDRLKGLIVFPRLVPVFASLILMLLVGSVTVNTIQIRQAQDREQGEYLVSLLSPAAGSSQAESAEAVTPIEHYFL